MYYFKTNNLRNLMIILKKNHHQKNENKAIFYKY